MEVKTILMAFLFSMLLLHEMDAVRAKEWRMFLFLKDLKEETAYRIFAVAHLPLYMAALIVMIGGSPKGSNAFYYILEVLLVLHGCVHFGFRKHKENSFTSLFSKLIIYGMAFFAVFHLIYLGIWN